MGEAGQDMGKAAGNTRRICLTGRAVGQAGATALIFSLTLSVSGFFSTPLQAATPVRFSGAVGGLVTDNAGKPQPGASVSLFNQQARLLQRAYTDLSGNFSFGDLLPDLYSIQVSMASFVPANKDRVQVRPGMRSLLSVSLSRMFSTIQVVSTVPAPGGLMSDDWKWALRADSSLRPVLRLVPADAGNKPPRPPADPTTASARTAVFHDSSALVRISASDGAQAQAATGEADLGTQFAFATSMYARNQLQVSGNVGYGSMTGTPATAIRTTFSRATGDDRPTVSVTMRQMNLPVRLGQSVTGSSASDGPSPALRTLSVSFSDKAQLRDSISFEYGSELDSISFIDHLQYFSPWARLTYAAPHGRVDMTFTSGNAHPGLGSLDPNDGLQTELAALALLPRLSMTDGHLKVQRGDDYEVGYSDVIGATEYRISGYHQYVANTTLTIANPDGDLFTGDLLASLFSSSAIFNAGNVSTSGYTVSATRGLGPNYKITAAYGLLGVMNPDTSSDIASAEDLRRMIRTSHRQALTARAAGTIRATGTRFLASYQYADLQSSIPIASFSTQPDRVEPGLNIAIRQPIGWIPGMAGRLEATAEMRNLLAQGYLPLSLTDGRQILIVNTPRIFRGGLAFVF
jgi:hypothetical protein